MSGTRKLIDLIASREAPVFFAPGRPVPRYNVDVLAAWVASKPVIIADEPAAWYTANWRPGGGTYKVPLWDELPPIVPPFPDCWVEWTQYRGDDLMRVGVEVSTAAVEDGWLVDSRLFEQMPAKGTAVWAMPYSAIGQIDREGRWRSSSPSVTDIVENRWVNESDWATFASAPAPAIKQSAQEMAVHAIKIAMAAFGFMACRNVRTETHELPAKLVRATRRRRGVEPVARWVTIRLPRPASAGRQAGSAAAGEHDPLALHVVRGHFKTFTPERPLLGRAVGTFFWPTHVRGSAEAGERHHVYEVGAPEAVR